MALSPWRPNRVSAIIIEFHKGASPRLASLSLRDAAPLARARVGGEGEPFEPVNRSLFPPRPRETRQNGWPIRNRQTKSISLKYTALLKGMVCLRGGGHLRDGN